MCHWITSSELVYNVKSTLLKENWAITSNYILEIISENNKKLR